MLSYEIANFLRDIKTTDRSISSLNHPKLNSGLWNSPDTITIPAFLEGHSNIQSLYYLRIFQATLSNVRLVLSITLTFRLVLKGIIPCPSCFLLISFHWSTQPNYISQVIYLTILLVCNYVFLLMRFLLPSVK